MAENGMAWVVHTHEHRERSNDWYWALGLAAIAGIGLCIFLGDILLAVIVGIAALSIGTLVARGPRTHWVRLESRGLILDGTLYPYRSLHSFWVEDGREDHHNDPQLLVSTTGFLHPQLIIPLEDPNRAGGVRAYLKKYMHEEEQHPHLGEHMARLFGL